MNISPAITPTDSQDAARRDILAWWDDANAPQEFYVAGFAGTGKTELLKLVLAELQERKRRALRVFVGTYTGKAANVLRKKGVPCSTIHSGIYRCERDEITGTMRFVLDTVTSPAAEADLIALDEVSMVNDAMANDRLTLLKRAA